MADKKKHSDMLEGLDAIARHAKRNQMVVIEWHQSWVGCPIQRDEKSGAYSCSVKALDKWMQERGLNRPRQKKF